MADIRLILRRESNPCAWCDFWQRIRLGLIGAALIIFAPVLYRCLF